MRTWPLLVILVAAACTQTPQVTLPPIDADMHQPDVGTDTGPSDVGSADVAPDLPPRPSDDVVAADREACTFGPGDTAMATVGAEFPIGDDMPFDHVILLMQENRSFDHYFGAMPGVDGFPPEYANLDRAGVEHRPFHETRYCIDDVGHSWNASHREYNGGANDGFVSVNDPDGARALGYYDDTDLPYYWALARTFAMSDHHFCSVLGPTWVNRYYFVAGTSFGLIRNESIPPDERPAGPHQIFHQLDDAEVDWKVYFETAPFIVASDPQYVLANRDKVVRMDEFFADLENGTLPSVAWLDPRFTVSGVEREDEHPPGNIQLGQQWVAGVIDAIMRSPAWERTVIIFTYDEHGGFFDHVPPPPACHPGDTPARVEAGDEPGDFDRLGFRVPLIVVSPYSKPGYVSDRVTDLTSVLRFVQARFGIGALTKRDANAWPLLDMFDFDNPPFLIPPALPEAVVDPDRHAECLAQFQ